MAKVPMRCTCEPAAPGHVRRCNCERMSEAEYEAYMDGLIAKSRRMTAIRDGTVDPDRLALHDRIVAYQDAHGVDYPTAFDRITTEEF